jgi:membrane protein YdbS with pleckstrin-like domain
LEKEIGFSNHAIDVFELPRIQDIKYENVDKKYLRVMVFNRVIVFILLAVAFLVVHYFSDESFDYVIEFFSVWTLLFFTVICFGYLKFKTLAFALREKDLVFKRGVLTLKTTIIPFNRIQHVAINQGPLMRWLDLSNLKIYTAGGSTSDLSINGLSSSMAESIKTFVTNKVSDEQPLESNQDVTMSSHGKPLTDLNPELDHNSTDDNSTDDIAENPSDKTQNS